MSYEAIRLDIDTSSRVATITLNRPDKLNSFTRAMHQELSDALGQVEASGARALVLTGCDHFRARKLAQVAHDEFARHEPLQKKQAAEVNRWLAANPL